MRNRYKDVIFDGKYGKCKVIYYKNYDDVIIEFLDTGYVTTSTMDRVKSGTVKDCFKPSVYGVGIVGNKYKTYENGKETKQYKTWSSMLERCHSESFKEKHKSYKGCTTSNNFRHYTYFYEWCEKQVGFGQDNFELDKDLLIVGNKLYSENTCVFIPCEINQTIKFSKYKYRTFDELCVLEYNILTLAEKYKHVIDKRAYKALVSFQHIY